MADNSSKDPPGVEAGYEITNKRSGSSSVENVVDVDHLRDAAAAAKPKGGHARAPSDADLDGLEELVPEIKDRRRSNEGDKLDSDAKKAAADAADDGVEVIEGGMKHLSVASDSSSTKNRNIASPTKAGGDAGGGFNRVDSMRVQQSGEFDDTTSGGGVKGEAVLPVEEANDYTAEDEASSASANVDEAGSDMYEGLDGNESDNAQGEDKKDDGENVPKEFLNNAIASSGQSLSTATQTHEVKMPMYLPTFKPATGCTNASDFIVRCFVARLRSGITVVKHGRSRWCKSRLRILHIHPDGCSLSWKPAEGEPTSNRRPPKLDLTQCLEVRHAWSPDPQNPMYTGTPILRQKCEAANAHKSFALIFPKRTVDITAVTADQCKVLMEGFSALCFRLQVADLAGKGGGAAGGKKPEVEDGVSTTGSVTLTNSSTPRAR